MVTKKSSEFTAPADADHYYTLAVVLYDLSFVLMKENEKINVTENQYS